MSDGRHPWFIDRAATTWRTRLDDALADAAQSGRRAFVLMARATSGGSRALVEKTIAKEEIAEYLNRHFVAVAADADAPDPTLAALLPSLPKRDPTPLCVYLAPDGRVLLSTAGGRPAAVFLNDLIEAHSKK